MIIRQLELSDTQDFCDLIVDMYSNLENLEWFSPMPYDAENVSSMIQNPRFYIIGAFEGDTLMGVSSLDYKCGKLIGKIDFPKNCNTDKLVEIGFNMVSSKHRGKGIMKQMVEFLLNKITEDGFEWVFSKVHKDNFASSKSLIKNNFEIYVPYSKPVKISDFVMLSSQDFFSEVGKQNAQKTLAKYSADATEIIVDYNILIKKL
jgi:RimJ/RimL family protein N-acetyltransferase